MAASQAGYFSLQEFTDAGALLVGGRVYTYSYGTTTQKTAYTDAAGLVPHTYTSDGVGGLYIALNSRGELPAPLYLTSGSYDITLKRSDASTVWTRRADGTGDGSVALTASLATSTGSSLIGFIQAGAGAVLRTVLAKLREFFQTPQDYGAVADGATNDGAAVRLAAASYSSTGGVLRFPRATYVMGASGGACLAISVPMNLVGDGGTYTAINTSQATASDDTISILPSSVDHTLTGVTGLHLGNPSTGLRTGRYGIYVDTQTAGRNVAKYTVRDVLVGQGSNAGFYHLNNATNNINGGMYCALFQNNYFKGGIKLENSGDSNSIVHNVLTGTGWGVNAALVSGASLLEIQANNITADYGAIKLASGPRFRILGNNIEHSAVGAVANNDSAVIDITGTSGTMYGGVLKENLISAFGSSDATTLIKIDNCRGTLIADNVLVNGGSATTGILVGSGCANIRIGPNTYNAAVTTKVTDNGTGTMGVVKTTTLQNGWVAYAVGTSTLKYIKSGDGMVHLYGSIASGTTANGTLIATLPTGFQPSETIRAAIYQTNGAGTTLIAEASIATDGKITINDVTVSTRVNFNITFPASNLADAVSLE